MIACMLIHVIFEPLYHLYIGHKSARPLLLKLLIYDDII